MVTLLAPAEVNSPPVTAAELLEQLGGISPARVRLRPPPGQATESDVLALHDRENRLFELVDGVLVEKAMGFRESVLALYIAGALNAFVRRANLGIVTGADGMMRLSPGTVRIPHVAYVAWNRVPDNRMPTAPLPSLVPDLAVEVLSASNTPQEMVRKRREYFEAGTRVVWMVDPDPRTLTVFAPGQDPVQLDATAVLTGGEVLPGFTMSLSDLFAELDRAQG